LNTQLLVGVSLMCLCFNPLCRLLLASFRVGSFAFLICPVRLASCLSPASPRCPACSDWRDCITGGNRKYRGGAGWWHRREQGGHAGYRRVHRKVLGMCDVGTCRKGRRGCGRRRRRLGYGCVFVCCHTAGDIRKSSRNKLVFSMTRFVVLE
jgi:hypothetical protein